MSLVLIENHPLQITFRYILYDFEYYDPNHLFKEVTSTTNLAFHCKNPFSKGKGVDSNNQFPWTVSPLAFSQRLKGKNGLSLHVILTVYKSEDVLHGDCSLTVRVEGDFLEMLQHVFNNVPSKISNLKMNFGASFRFQDNSTTTIPCEMTATNDKSGNIIFEQTSEISRDTAEVFIKANGQSAFAELTVELVGVELNKTVASLPSGFGSKTTARQIDVPSTSKAAYSSGKIKLGSNLEEMTRCILEKKLLSDYTLVARTGQAFRCNKVFLAARSPLFEALFQSETEKDKCRQLKLNLSEEGVNALLKFVYYSDIEIPETDPDVTLELLGVASELQMPSLEEAMKGVLIRQPDNY